MAKKPKAPETPAEPRPDAAFVLSLYRARLQEGDEARLRAIAAQMRALTRMEHKVAIPRQYRAITKAVRTPYVRDAWHRITAALCHERPVAHVEPLDATDASRRAANLAERWTEAVLERLTRELNEDVVYEAPRALTRDGESVIKVVHKPDAWATFPERLRGESADDFDARTERFKKTANTSLPLTMRVVDRLQCLFSDGEYGDEWALEFGEYPRPHLASRYGMRDTGDRLVRPEFVLGGAPWPEGYAQSANGMSQKIEYWSADWWHVVIDGQDAPGFPQPNPIAPKLPYVRAKADSDSESALYSLLYLAPGLDQALTMKTNWAYLGAFPNPMLKTVPTAATGGVPDPLGEGDEGSPLRWAPGKLIEVPAGKEMGFLVPPPVGADLNELITIYRSLVDVAGVPAIMRSAGGESGYDTNQKMAAAVSMYRRLALASGRQLEQACELLWWIVQHRIMQTVYVLARGDGDDGARKWLGLGTDVGVSASVAPVERLGPLTFEYRPQLPTDEQARAIVANQLVNAPKQLISRREARQRFLAIEDPEAMADEIAVENALDEPPLKDLWVQRALKEAGMLEAPPAPPGPPMPPGGPMLPPGPGEINASPVGAIPPGGAAAGFPAVPGVSMPMVPPPPGIPPGSSVPGGFPGQPGGQGPPPMLQA